MTNSLQSNTGTHTKEGIPGSTLKIIAIVSMLIDHIAAIILNDYLMQNIDLLQSTQVPKHLLVAYYTTFAMRCIGRLAFPLFCFLLIEGYVHTHNKWKYAGRLFLFAIISEIPFDIANKQVILEFTYQNVFFTLCIGLVVIILYEEITKRFEASKIKVVLLQSLVMVAGILLALLLKTDYNCIGVLTIITMYHFRHNRKKEILFGSIALIMVGIIEILALAIIPLVTRYNGKRGIRLKYVFYLFYPVHLLLLSLISYLLGFR